MKKCPTCNRTYPDDTLAFCLADGGLLSAPYDPNATLVLSSAATNVSPGQPTIPFRSPEPIPTPGRGTSKLVLAVLAAAVVAFLFGGGMVALILLKGTNTTTSIKPASTSSTPPEIKSKPTPAYKTRTDFSTDEEYGKYIKSELKTGDRVRAIADYDKVKQGMTGTHYDTAGTSDPPCFVIWDTDLGSISNYPDEAPPGKRSYAYWVQWYQIEIIE